MKTRPGWMTPWEFEKAMEAIATKYSTDVETRHIEGDFLMVELLEALGYERGAALFRSWRKWYA